MQKSPGIYTFLHSFYFSETYKISPYTKFAATKLKENMYNCFAHLDSWKLVIWSALLLTIQCGWQATQAQSGEGNFTSGPKGLRYEILQSGSGITAKSGDEVVIHEQMGYTDGTILYSTRNAGSTVRFLLGGNQAIAGIDLGMQGMKKGEIRKLLVPPALSKRTQYPNFLSPDSTLLYTIELIDIIPPPDFPPLSAQGKIIQQIGFNTITIEYERPSVRGRRIFGGLVPFDTLWKTGAGAGPKLSFDGPVVIEGYHIPAGVYSLMTIPGASLWTVILTRDTTFYTQRKDYEPSKEVARFQVEPKTTARFYESFTIDIDVIPHNADILLSWEHTQVRFTLKTGTDDQVSNYVQEELLTGKSQNPQLYATAADYFYFGNKELETALILVDIAIKKGPQPWHFRLKMDILERLNRYEEAILVGDAAIKFIQERSEALGWDVPTREQSIKEYQERIKDLKAKIDQ